MVFIGGVYITTDIDFKIQIYCKATFQNYQLKKLNSKTCLAYTYGPSHQEEQGSSIR